MPRGFSAALHTMRHIQRGDKAWLWFLQIKLADSTFLRMVKDRDHRMLGQINDADEHVVVAYQRADFKISDPSIIGGGSLEDEAAGEPFTIELSNVSRIPLTKLETEGEPLGRELTVTLAHESETQEPYDPPGTERILRSRVLRVTATPTTVTLYCGAAPSPLIPSQIFTRDQYPTLPASGANA